MTSEVAVMNRLAVALAADSAVTVRRGKKNKVYNSANKVFMLSQRHPVGVMVFGNGSLLGVPWETLIKSFRQELGDAECPRLADYATRLLEFVERQRELFPRVKQRNYFLAMVEAHFEALARRIKRRIDQAEARGTSELDREALLKNIVAAAIREDHAQWQGHDRCASIPENAGANLAGECSGEIGNLVAKHFRTKAWVADAAEVPLLNELATFLVDRVAIEETTFSGVVVAGFGFDDYFPALSAIGVGEIYGDRLKLVQQEEVSINDETPVHVGVYGDSDMANVFIQGISATFELEVIERAFDMTTLLTQDILTAAKPNEGERINLEGYAAVRRNELMMDFVDGIELYKRKQKEFEDALEHLPKDELASVATSLVSLNSFKKKLSFALETVGGPVDLAVISKGDGFVWIDRKHYFKPELNHHFFQNRDWARSKLGRGGDRP